MKLFLLIITLAIVAALVSVVMVQIMIRRVLRAGARLAIEAAWKKVLAHENLTLKVVEADKVLDEALKLLGYRGSLGDKLKAAGPRFRDVEALWAAHKLRNKLVHELDQSPADREVDEAVKAFHAALTDLGARL